MIGIFVNLWSRISGAGAYLLDQFGGAAAAYSLRRLSSSYGGPAIRVRRSLDNAEQDIGFQGKDLDEPSLMNFVGYQNLLQRSEEFNDAYWFKQESTVTSNTILSPINTLTADSVFETTANTVHGIQKSVSVTLGQSYNFSCYIRPINGREGVTIRFGNGSTDSSNGTYIGSATFNFISESLIPDVVTNFQFQKIGEWYRLSASIIPTASTLSIAIWGRDASSVNYAGDPTKGLYLWGAQLSTGTALQPYQVTTSAARSGDGFVTKWYTQDSNGENLLLQSQTFENASWTKNQSTIAANVTTAPDGTLTGESFVPTTVSAPHFVIQPISKVASSLIYTVSAYVKPFGYNFVTLGCTGADNSNQATVSIDLVTLSKTNFTGGVGFSAINSYVTAEANGWYRVSLTLSSDSSISIQPVVRVDNTFNNAVYAGNGTSGIYIWGAQLSQSSWLQGYQATTTAQVFRRDASQSTAANQPQIVNGGNIVLENGKPAMLFDGVNDTFSVPSGLDVLQNVGFANSFAVVANNAAAAGNKSIISVTTSLGNSRFYPYFSGTTFSTGGRRLDADSFASVAGVVARSVQALFYSAVQYTTSDAFQYVNGLLDGSNTSFQTDGNTSNTASTSVTIGSVVGGGSDFFNGDMQEITLYNTNQLPNRVNIESSINSYYKIY